MAELLGVLSSLVACYEILAPAVKYVGQLYKAPREVKALQEQINVFDAVIRSIERRTTASRTPILANAIQDGRSIVDEVNAFLTTKFGAGRSKQAAYCSSWARNRRKFMRFSEKLERNRSRVKEAILTELYITVHRSVAIANYGKEADLEVAPLYDRAQANESCLPVRAKLSGSSADDPYHSHAGTASPTSHGNLSGPITCREESEWQDEDEACTARASLAVSSRIESQRVIRTSEPCPVSRFERLSSFYPEIYTNTMNMPILFNYLIEETHASDFMRISECALFYLSAPRRWIRISATITTTHNSKYWSATKARTSNVGVLGNYSLPLTLNRKVEEYLGARSDIKQDCHLNIYLDCQRAEGGSPASNTSDIRLTRPRLTSGIQQLLTNATEAIVHSGVPWYDEAQLDIRTTSRQSKRAEILFMAWLECRWVLAYCLATEESHLRKHLNFLEVLHALRGSTHVAALLGVFSRTPGTGVINGFLWEPPVSGRLVYALSAHAHTGNVASMQRRVAWCRDLVQGLAEIHRKKHVVGAMHRQTCGVGIDSQDRAVFYSRFSNSFSLNGHAAGILPPEYRGLATSDVLLQSTYRTDLYHLGFLLWRLVEDKMMGRACELAGCDTPRNAACDDLHPDPTQLPWINNDVPTYLREVISICRSENPHERLPAWRLLDYFPPCLETNTRTRSVAGLDCFTRFEDLFERLGDHTTCDRCGQFTMPHYFHCSLCDDFDVCPKCFDSNVHCLDAVHWLREKLSSLKEDRYWSCPDQDGQRQIVTV